MNSMEQKRKNDVLREIDRRFREIYPTQRYGKNECFLSSKGQIFRPFAFTGDNALAIEYAETPDDAEKNLFEDGDRFYLSELSISELFKAMVAEVEG